MGNQMKAELDRLKAANPQAADEDLMQNEEYNELQTKLNKKLNQMQMNLAKVESNECSKFDQFYVGIKQPAENNVCAMFKNKVFLSFSDLIKALNRAGIYFELRNEYIEKAFIQTKDQSIETEYAR